MVERTLQRMRRLPHAALLSENTFGGTEGIPRKAPSRGMVPYGTSGTSAIGTESTFLPCGSTMATNQPAQSRSEAVLPRQFDAYVWFDRTTAVTPLPGEPVEGEEETYPFGL